MTDTEIAPDHVDMSVEDDSAASGADYWAGSTQILGSPAPEMPVENAASAAPPPPPPTNDRPEPLRLFVKLGHIFSGGPNGR